MPKPLLKMTKKQATTPKVPVSQVKAVKLVGKTTTPAGFFTQDGKPDVNGLFDKDGYQVRLTAAKPVKKKEEPDQAAIRAGFKR